MRDPQKSFCQHQNFTQNHKLNCMSNGFTIKYYIKITSLHILSILTKIHKFSLYKTRPHNENYTLWWKFILFVFEMIYPTKRWYCSWKIYKFYFIYHIKLFWKLHKIQWKIFASILSVWTYNSLQFSVKLENVIKYF